MEQKRTFIVGVGMTKFYKPGTHDFEYHDLATLAMKRALNDANLTFEKHIEQVYCGYVYGDSTCGQRCVYELGRKGIPIFNINNNGCTGASTIFLARQAVAAGVAECVLAVGFEKMFQGPVRNRVYQDRSPPTLPLDKRDQVLSGTPSKASLAVRIFANVGGELMDKHGIMMDKFVSVAYKNRMHGVNNPYAQFQNARSKHEISQSKMLKFPLTMLQCCANSDGAASIIICTEFFLLQHGLQYQAVEIRGMSMASDTAQTFNGDFADLAGNEMTKRCAAEAYKQANLQAADVNVVELHDSISSQEVLSYESLGLCTTKTISENIQNDYFTYGGVGPVVNPSGGIISRGHAISATGVAQCVELCWQLRFMAEARQVKGAKIGLQHSIGLGGACCVALYSKYLPESRGTTRLEQTSDLRKIETFEQQEMIARSKL